MLSRVVRATPLALLLVGLAPASNAFASAGLDVDRWLDKSGVQLLAVEFYATWCEPCMDAVPRWRKLHDEYRRKGLRLVVVAVSDPKGGCTNPGWNPDDVICDDDGTLAERFGAVGSGGSLPAAFLWNWRGELLANHATVEVVEQEVRSHFNSSPSVRVHVQDVARRSGLGHSQLRHLLKDDLRRRGKLRVALTRYERDQIAKMQPSPQARAACKTGESITHSSQLEASIRLVQNRHRLQMALLSTERGCMVAATAVAWNPESPGRSVSEALDDLTGKLRPAVQLPFAARASRARAAAYVDEPLREQPSDDAQTDRGKQVIVTFESVPTGAVVHLDGGLLCQDTSKGCSRTVPVGRHTVRMEKEGFLARAESVAVRDGTAVKWTLKKNVGVVSVTSEPVGLDVKIDGRVVGQTPLLNHEVSLGTHQILVSSGCHYDSGRRVTIRRGEHKSLKETPTPRMGTMHITAMAGSVPLAASVTIDGVAVGKTPGRFKVTTCTKKVVVTHATFDTWTREISVPERETTRVKAVLQVSGDVKARRGVLQWRMSEAAGVAFTRSEVTVGQYRACVRAGGCKKDTLASGVFCNYNKPGRGRHPMNCVNWFGADQFCRWAGGRLPTEKEWFAEASNRGMRKYPWGRAKATCGRAIMNAGGRGCGKNRTWPVCSGPDGNSVSGLCDMSGNVWEWTSTGSSAWRVLRGGSWNYDSQRNLRASARLTKRPSVGSSLNGFRCARSPD